MGGRHSETELTTVEELRKKDKAELCFMHCVLCRRRRLHSLRVRQVVEVADHRQPGQDDCSRRSYDAFQSLEGAV